MADHLRGSQPLEKGAKAPFFILSNHQITIKKIANLSILAGGEGQKNI
jgi:hypothetical protein